MSLPSLLDIVTVVILVVPGFLSFTILKRALPFKREKFSDFELTVYSLLFMLPIIFCYSIITGLKDIDSIRDSVFQPINLATLIGLSLGWGLAPSLIAKVLTWGKYRTGECWDIFWDGLRLGGYVLVLTEDGHEYKGWIQYSDKSEEKYELILGDPTLVIRDASQKMQSEVKMGHAMLFTQKDIRRVSSLQPIE